MMKTHTIIIWIVIRTDMFMKKTNKNIDIHLYRNVHDENPYKNNIEIHLYRNVHDEKAYKNNMDSNSYRNVHEKNQKKYG